MSTVVNVTGSSFVRTRRTDGPTGYWLDGWNCLASVLLFRSVLSLKHSSFFNLGVAWYFVLRTFPFCEVTFCKIPFVQRFVLCFVYKLPFDKVSFGMFHFVAFRFVSFFFIIVKFRFLKFRVEKIPFSRIPFGNLPSCFLHIPAAVCVLYYSQSALKACPSRSALAMTFRRRTTGTPGPREAWRLSTISTSSFRRDIISYRTRLYRIFRMYRMVPCFLSLLLLFPSVSRRTNLRNNEPRPVYITWVSTRVFPNRTGPNRTSRAV